MANLASAKKAIRSQQRKWVKNVRRRRAIALARKQVQDAVKSGDQTKAAEALNVYYTQIDKAAKHNGPLHKNTAARYKSRVARLVNSAFATN